MGEEAPPQKTAKQLEKEAKKAAEGLKQAAQKTKVAAEAGSEKAEKKETVKNEALRGYQVHKVHSSWNQEGHDLSSS